MKFLKILGMFAAITIVSGLLFVAFALNVKSLPQAVIPEAGSNSVIVAETSFINEGLPISVKLTRYSFATNKGVGVFNGRPATRFCKGAGFPSHQSICLYSTEPFDPNAVGKQQTVNFETWVAVSS